MPISVSDYIMEWTKISELALLVVCFLAYTVGECPESWILMPNTATCFYRSSETDRRTYNSSWERCLSLGGMLASLSSPEYSTYIYEEIIGPRKADTWVGLWKVGRTDGSIEKRRTDWTWLSGKSYTWTNWYGDGHSDEPTGESGCARVREDGFWGDTFCDREFSYICETSAQVVPKIAAPTRTTPSTTPSTSTTTSPSTTTSRTTTSTTSRTTSSSTSSPRSRITTNTSSTAPKTSILFRAPTTPKTNTSPSNIVLSPSLVPLPTEKSTASVVVARIQSSTPSSNSSSVTRSSSSSTPSTRDPRVAVEKPAGMSFYMSIGIPTAAGVVLIFTGLCIWISVCRHRRKIGRRETKEQLERLRNAGLIVNRITIPGAPPSPPASLVDVNDVPDVIDEDGRQKPPLTSAGEEPYVTDVHMDSVTDLYE